MPLFLEAQSIYSIAILLCVLLRIQILTFYQLVKLKISAAPNIITMIISKTITSFYLIDISTSFSLPFYTHLTEDNNS